MLPAAAAAEKSAVSASAACATERWCEADTAKSDSGKGVGSDVSPANSARGRSSVYATVLKCGHQFHDECIVPVLNETLRCPTCHHLEIQ